ncbi:S8 family serine peptidase [Anaerobacillus sp. HL2]|nr:S8 family serine peptidase [Anaerobacillus sp. HL2]
MVIRAISDKEKNYLRTIYRKEEDKVATFSSRGPVINLGVKPDVVAPGVAINSTIPNCWLRVK